MEGKKFLSGTIQNHLVKPITRRVAALRFPSVRFIPLEKTKFENTVPTLSAWKGLEEIIPSILQQFHIPKNHCLEFGVEYGFSTAIFAQLFDEVIGVDTFEGDAHAGYQDTYQKARENLKSYPNVTLVKSSYQEFIHRQDRQYDLCHVDIIHTYKDTFTCGDWAASHCKCVLFHDTVSFPQVRQAVFDIARKHGKIFYNYPFHHGLGIIV
ncbi:MAG TPA: class I SAM-dependent methyltransferase [Saprospiraceae bacterium]|nr:class I SAM-dependent methyltransferase [Saprospiraceae bacterium]HNT22658.1 class I SAM-dependent methyltransferase [Saprospiraceae bacterium]